MTVAAPRLDAELVRRGLARSRARAAELVAAGRVTVDEAVARKPSQPVPDDAALAVADDAADPGYVSRAAYKLAGALDLLGDIGPVVDGAACLDAGASTGGFTQVLLERGARHVLAVDVGHGQMASAVAKDPRVTVREGVNVRDLDPSTGPMDLVVADLSFISLTVVLPALLTVARPGTDLLLMVKPQFEVGRARIRASGVVTSPELREEAVLAVAAAAGLHGARVRAVVPSPLPGPAGNREYFLWLTCGPAPSASVDEPGPELEPAVAPTPAPELVAAVTRAVRDDTPVVLDGRRSSR